MITVGDAFYGPLNKKNRTPHLWVVILVKVPKLLWVNVTKYRKGRDNSCVLIPGEHPFIIEASIINYYEANDPLITNVENALEAGYLVKRQKFSQELIDRVIEGAINSCFLKVKYKSLLTEDCS